MEKMIKKLKIRIIEKVLEARFSTPLFKAKGEANELRQQPRKVNCPSSTVKRRINTQNQELINQ